MSGNGRFEFAQEGLHSGVPVVNGHQILTAESVQVSISAVDIPKVMLHLMAADGLNLVFTDARVIVDDETREALISLGWTPPS